jgi:DNA (cytosine-5)-methyltransferase 1
MKKAGPGYKLVIHAYKFEQYGIPQARHRMIIVGIRSDLAEKGVVFRVPAPSGKTMTASQALAKIPKTAKNQELTKQSPVVVERLKHIKPGENVWNAKLPKHLQLNVKGAKLSQIYKRLDPDKPSYTITGSGGGGTHVYHWSENRSLTNRERARLQTFPDDYVFSGSKEQVRKQIGMAVPPAGVAIIVEAVAKSFQKKAYKSVNASIEE